MFVKSRKPIHSLQSSHFYVQLKSKKDHLHLHFSNLHERSLSLDSNGKSRTDLLAGSVSFFFPVRALGALVSRRILWPFPVLLSATLPSQCETPTSKPPGCPAARGGVPNQPLPEHVKPPPAAHLPLLFLGPNGRFPLHNHPSGHAGTAKTGSTRRRTSFGA